MDKKEDEQEIPKQALEKTNAELAKDSVVDATNGGEGTPKSDAKPTKKPNAFKKLFKKVDIYLFGVILIIVVAAAFTTVNYLNSKKVQKAATVNSKNLTGNALKALSGTNATVDSAAQTLTVQGNAIFSGQVLIKGALSVAGVTQLSNSLTVPNLTVSATANLGTTQAKTLQVAQNLTVQGTTGVASLTVSGVSTFSQPITASQISVTTLILSGSGILRIPNHVDFTGPSPSRANISTTALGPSGSASVNGSDTIGTINVNTGGTTAAGCFITINFNQAFAAAPHVIVSPVGIGASETQYYVTITAAGFSLCTSNAAPTNQVFSFDYFVVG